jgi:hypothetical protein
MNDDRKTQTYVHVTIAILNNPSAFFAHEHGNGFIMGGVRVPMHSAVFCGKVLATKVKR